MSEIYAIVHLLKEVVKEGGFFSEIFQSGTISGRIVDQYKNPIPGATVCLQENKFEKTMQNGKFLFEKAKGKYIVSVEYKGSKYKNLDVILVKGGQELWLDIMLKLDQNEAPQSSKDQAIRNHSPTHRDQAAPTTKERSLEIMNSPNTYKDTIDTRSPIKPKDLEKKLNIKIIKKLLDDHRAQRRTQIMTSDLIREYTGHFLTNKGLPPAHSFNANFGKYLQKNAEELCIKKTKGSISIRDDDGNSTKTAEWDIY